MAEAEKSGEGAPGGKKKRLLLMIVGGAFALLLIIGIALFFLLRSGGDADEEDAKPVAEEKKKSKKDAKPDAPPVFVKLDTFTVKLQPTEGQQMDSYLQAMPELRVIDASVGERVKVYMPEIRHRTLLILSGKKAADLSSPQGVERLSFEIREEINTILEGRRKKSRDREDEKASVPDRAAPEDPVQAVLFTSFIIQ